MKQLDRRTRKLLTMHKGLHPKSNVDILYISRKEGGRGLLNVEDTVHLAIIGLLKYVGNSEEQLLNAARQALGHVEETETEKESKLRRKNERKADLERQGVTWSIYETDRRGRWEGKVDMAEWHRD